MNKDTYFLSKLPYGYADLAPVISKEQLTLHHDKHHAAYVEGANAILQKLDLAHQNGTELEMKPILKELSFFIGGHILHSIFWENMAAVGTGGELKGSLKTAIEKDFGSVDQFKSEFAKTALSVEGSGWVALAYCKKTGRLILMQIEKHNVNIYPMFAIVMVLDVWEHAYYLDYQNKRGDFIKAFWDIVNWDKVSQKLQKQIDMKEREANDQKN